MPSPLAHASLALLARPLTVRHPLSRRRRWAWCSLLVVTLCLPDVDFVLMLTFDHPLYRHGTFTHSLGAAGVVAPLFAVAARLVLGRAVSWWVLMCTGFVAYSSHLLLDLFTPGSGVMLLWPVSPVRVSSPWPLFFGAHHSQPWAWQLHLITLVSELAFVAVVWWVGRWVMPARLGGRGLPFVVFRS